MNKLIFFILFLSFPLLANPKLYDAASEGNLEEIKKILSTEKANIDYQNELGNTPLIQAAYKGHLEIVKFLVERRANINAQAKDGWTALMAAFKRET